jgi:hypothetical protein
MQSSRGDIKNQSKFTVQGEPTQLSSSQSNGNGFFDLPQSFGKNYEELDSGVANSSSTLENTRSNVDINFECNVRYTM